jgi:hypothetical protein
MSAELRTHLQNERLGIVVTSVRGLPLGVRNALQELFGGSTLDIDEPGAPLKTRRLVLAGCSYDHCLVYYERGGATHTFHAALFHWTPDATSFEFGGPAPAGLKTTDELRSAVLSGAIKSPASVKQGSPGW